MAPLKFLEMYPLKKLCTLGIGGAARYLLEVQATDEMQQALKYCHQKKLPYFILGKGSNCLFSDEGFDGLVIVNKISFLNHSSSSIFHVGSGYSFSLLGVQTARLGYSGLEFASGIPATVGGAVYMNAGANGGETCDALMSVDYIDEQGCLKNFSRRELQFAYRFSPFQKLPGAIVGATFELKTDPQARQKQLEILAYRKKTQPLAAKSAGCIFQNPAGDHAGKLIEACGLKGTNIGGAEVSQVHANFLINKDAATAKELLALISEIKKQVKNMAGIELQSELRIIPYLLENA